MNENAIASEILSASFISKVKLRATKNTYKSTKVLSHRTLTNKGNITL